MRNVRNTYSKYAVLQQCGLFQCKYICYNTVTTVLVDWSILFPLYRMEDRHLPVGSSEIQELGALVRRFVAKQTCRPSWCWRGKICKFLRCEQLYGLCSPCFVVLPVSHVRQTWLVYTLWLYKEHFVLLGVGGYFKAEGAEFPCFKRQPTVIFVFWNSEMMYFVSRW